MDISSNDKLPVYETIGQMYTRSRRADLMLAAGWRRPERYLNPDVRAGISSFALSDPEATAEGVERLRRDLESGVWEERYGSIRKQESFDAGYRFFALRCGNERSVLR